MKARGEAVGMAKMREEQVREIRRLREAGESLTDLAEKYCLSGSTVHQICERKTWRHVADDWFKPAALLITPTRRRRVYVRNWAGKVSEEQVKAIRAKYLANEPAGGLAIEYGLTKAQVMAIVRRTAWRHVA